MSWVWRQFLALTRQQMPARLFTSIESPLGCPPPILWAEILILSDHFECSHSSVVDLARKMRKTYWFYCTYQHEPEIIVVNYKTTVKKAPRILIQTNSDSWIQGSILYTVQYTRLRCILFNIHVRSAPEPIDEKKETM